MKHRERGRVASTCRIHTAPWVLAATVALAACGGGGGGGSAGVRSDGTPIASHHTGPVQPASPRGLAVATRRGGATVRHGTLTDGAGAAQVHQWAVRRCATTPTPLRASPW